MNLESNARPTSAETIGVSPNVTPSPMAQLRPCSSASFASVSARTLPQKAAAQAIVVMMCFEFIVSFVLFC